MKAMQNNLYDVYYTGNNSLGNIPLIGASTEKEAATIYLNKNKTNFVKLKYGYPINSEIYKLICVTKCEMVNGKIYVAGKKKWYQVIN